MRYGDLDTRLTAQTASHAWDAGERVDAWSDGPTFWASVDERTGREAIRAGQVDAEAPVVVTARYADAAALTPKDRLRRGGTEAEPEGVLRIVGARDVGRRRWRELLCVEDRDGGA